MKKTLVYISELTLFFLGIFLIISCGDNSQKTENLPSAKEKADESFRNALRDNLSDVATTNEIAAQELKRAEEKVVREAEEAKERQKSQIREALQGTWEWSGRIKINNHQSINTFSRIVIKGDVITEYMDGELFSKGYIQEIDYETGMIYYGNDTYLEFDWDPNGNLKLYGDRKRGIQFKKASNNSSQSHASIRDYTFRRDQDVYEYLSSHRFTSGDLTLYFGNGGTVMYSNGNRLSNALRVSDFDTRYAVLAYTSPYSPGTKTFTIDNKAGTLTDRSGEVYYSR